MIHVYDLDIQMWKESILETGNGMSKNMKAGKEEPYAEEERKPRTEC